MNKLVNYVIVGIGDYVLRIDEFYEVDETSGKEPLSLKKLTKVEQINENSLFELGGTTFENFSDTLNGILSMLHCDIKFLDRVKINRLLWNKYHLIPRDFASKIPTKKFSSIKDLSNILQLYQFIITI